MNLYQDDIEAGRRIASEDFGADLPVEYWAARAAARRVAIAFLNRIAENEIESSVVEAYYKLAAEVAPD